MTFPTLATIFAAGFLIMTPMGPVSTMCIRRVLLYGKRAGIAAGAGDAVAVTVYASIGVTGSTLLPRFFAPFATVWHVAISLALVAIAIVIWTSRPGLANIVPPTKATLAGSFGATLAVALANPADVVLFAALFSGLGIGVHTSLDQLLFGAAILAGGCAYWMVLSFVLDRWRAGLTVARIVVLNRSCAALMLIASVASLVALVRTAN